MIKEESYKNDEYNVCPAIRELLEDYREEGRREGLAEARAEARAEAEQRALTLACILIDQNRLGDLKKIQDDVEYRKKLYADFNL